MINTKDWTMEEDSILKRMVNLYTNEQLAVILNRTYGSIRSRKNTLKLTKPRNPDWSVDEISKLKKFYRSGIPVRDIAKIFNRTEAATGNRIQKLKIKRK